MSPATKLIERMTDELDGDDRIRLVLAPMDDDQVSVEDLHVEPADRWGGLARRTMERLSELADEAGVELVLYACVPKNVEPGLSTEALRAFYNRLGYDGADSGHMLRLPDPMMGMEPIPASCRMDL